MVKGRSVHRTKAREPFGGFALFELLFSRDKFQVEDAGDRDQAVRGQDDPEIHLVRLAHPSCQGGRDRVPIDHRSKGAEILD